MVKAVTAAAEVLRKRRRLVFVAMVRIELLPESILERRPASQSQSAAAWRGGACRGGRLRAPGPRTQRREPEAMLAGSNDCGGWDELRGGPPACRRPFRSPEALSRAKGAERRSASYHLLADLWPRGAVAAAGPVLDSLENAPVPGAGADGTTPAPSPVQST